MTVSVSNLNSDMTSFISSNCCNWSVGVSEHVCSKGRFHKLPNLRFYGPYFPLGGISFSQGQGQYLATSMSQSHGRCRPTFSSAVDDAGTDPDDDENGNDEKQSSQGENEGTNSEMLRENLERIVGKDDSTFSGLDLATLIRNKYGRSYDVQLIKKEFMGRNLLALNVMWKYMEQRSFPLTEEEYLLRLDDVANTLKCWGAVSHIRNSLAKLKERPRIGKAVSIFIDMDESGGRANEWIYK
ncbi:uncharacterized protein LOC111318107 isoform X1 [Durio zibethinus]|uniref:Uncharacterized protein LOC111318107 isoform X1 n=1 Tax=Durio zibethinus TaxID=66656 RepID=A0A6P6BHC1_DURZI|nr:uncharacterized protein LOC111318107 isoform X1 [Durio zibethinus]